MLLLLDTLKSWVYYRHMPRRNKRESGSEGRRIHELRRSGASGVHRDRRTRRLRTRQTQKRKDINDGQ